jgi:hypothetical protein
MTDAGRASRRGFKTFRNEQFGSLAEHCRFYATACANRSGPAHLHGRIPLCDGSAVID